jgi:hypothetical protein
MRTGKDMDKTNLRSITLIEYQFQQARFRYHGDFSISVDGIMWP